MAVTRAQALLIVIGDPAVLSLDPIWRGFMEYVHDIGGWKGVPMDWVPGATDVLEQRRAEAAQDIDELAQRLEEVVLDSVVGVDWSDDGPGPGDVPSRRYE